LESFKKLSEQNAPPPRKVEFAKTFFFFTGCVIIFENGNRGYLQPVFEHPFLEIWLASEAVEPSLNLEPRSETLVFDPRASGKNADMSAPCIATTLQLQGGENLPLYMISRDFNTVTTLWSHLTGDENSNSSA
jgi:hypothetical protein